MNKKLHVAIIYGGQSGEHEISLRSAASVLRKLDRALFEPILIGIDKQGRWLLQKASQNTESTDVLTIDLSQPEVSLRPSGAGRLCALIDLATKESIEPQVDVVFPVIHGSLGEDGALQGLLELAHVPYVGCGVLSSALCMDKEMAKRLVASAGIDVVPWITLFKPAWQREKEPSIEAIERRLGYPCFIKPANAGSSVGVTKAKSRESLLVGIEDAFRYDEKVLIEQSIDAREIEVAVLEDSQWGAPALASVAGEITPHHEFYSYEAKYIDENGASLHVPADLTPTQEAQVRASAISAFSALSCEGMGRVDFFLSRATGQFFFNEINTIPGFTSISMYPKLWDASGLSYPELITTLLHLAVRRHQRKESLLRHYTSQK